MRHSASMSRYLSSTSEPIIDSRLLRGILTKIYEVYIHLTQFHNESQHKSLHTKDAIWYSIKYSTCTGVVQTHHVLKMILDEADSIASFYAFVIRPDTL